MDKITVNGKEYASLKDVPDEYKVIFKDANNNGIPDFVEGILAGVNDMHVAGSNPAINANFSSFFFNGKQYGDINQLPPEARQMVEKGLSSFEKTGMKITKPFTAQQEINTQNVFNQHNPVNTVNSNPTTKDVMHEEGLSKNFKTRLMITVLLFIMAIIYIIWLLKLI